MVHLGCCPSSQGSQLKFYSTFAISQTTFTKWSRSSKGEHPQSQPSGPGSVRKDRARVSFRMQQERFPKGLGRKKLDWIRREQGLKEVTESPGSQGTEIRNLATRNVLGTRPFLQNTPHLFLPGRDVNQPCLTEGKTEAPTVK